MNTNAFDTVHIFEPNQDLATSPSEGCSKQTMLLFCFTVIPFWWSFVLCLQAMAKVLFEPEYPAVLRNFRTSNGSWLMDHWVSVLSFLT